MELDQIVNDLSRRYSNTFVFVKEPNSCEETLFFVERIEADASSTGRIHLKSDEVGRIILNIGSTHELKFVRTPVGVFQSGKDAMLCRRIPQKQFRRGICPDNTRLEPVTARIARFHTTSFDFDTIRAAFVAKVFTFKDALAALSTKKIRSVALKDNYAMSVSTSRSDDHVLFYWDTPIARVTPSGKASLIYEQAFAPQVHRICSGD